MNRKYAELVLFGLVAAIIALFFVLAAIASGSDVLSTVAVAILMVAAVTISLAMIISALPNRKSLLPVNPYKALKRKTIRKLRKEQRLGLLTDRKLRDSMDDFVYEAVMLGYTRYTAEMDWMFEIQWKVKKP